MDVHRSRFVPYPASEISALAFSRASDTGYPDPPPALKLAIGRVNGTIEIWDPQQGYWIQESVFPGNGRSIDALLWTQDVDDSTADGVTIVGQHRLFSISSSPAVTEWNLGTGTVKRRSTGNFSEVWCFAAQPRIGSTSQDIAAGCGDGNLVLLSTAEDDLQFTRTLARVSGKNARCMCITYQTRDRVVAGFADSIIRIYDTRNGSLLRNMSLGVGRPGAPNTALVWQVKCLPNGDIVSGDSNGDLRIWDGKTYSLSQRLAGHDSDCLDLITSNDGKQIFSGSIDGKIAVYRYSFDGGRSMWVKNSHRKLHSGEVKAMAAFDSNGMSVLVTGGGDAAPAVVPLRGYGKDNVRFLPGLPNRPALVSASKARLVVSWWDKTISIWKMAKQDPVNESSERRRPRKLVARVHMESQGTIRTVAISSDGKVLAAASSDSIKVFQLRRKPDCDTLAVRRLELPTDLVTEGARLLEFSPDGKWLFAATPDSSVYVARLVQHPTKQKQLQILPSTVELDLLQRGKGLESAFRKYDRSLMRAGFSGDSKMLVVSDRSGYFDSWLLQGDEDPSAPAVGVARSVDAVDSDSDSDSDSSDDDPDTAFFGQRWVENPAGKLLPKLDSMAVVITFRAGSQDLNGGVQKGKAAITNGSNSEHMAAQPKYRLWILTAMHEMYEFDLQAGKLSDWSRKNKTSSLPAEFSKIRDRVMGALWDASGEDERLWLYGSSFVCMLDVGLDLNDQGGLQMSKKRHNSTGIASNAEMRKRRKLESGTGSKDMEGIVNGYNGHERKFRDEATDQTASTDNEITPRRKWWCSHRYFPILGIVPLADDLDGPSSQPLEVVLVERPLRRSVE